MIRLTIRSLLMVMLAAHFVAGLSYFVAATNTMAIEMARPAAMEPIAMDCDHPMPEQPCNTGLIHCPTGCPAPCASLPESGTLVPRVPDASARLAAVSRLATGLTRPPGLPPPRTSSIG